MKRHLILMASLVLASMTATAAGPKAEPMSAAEAFSRLKTLAGDWEGDSQMGKVHRAMRRWNWKRPLSEYQRVARIRGSATIESLQRAAKIVGRELRLQLV